MRETAELCRQSNHPALVTISAQLANALDALEEATDWMMAQAKSDSLDVLAGATAYLRLFGLASGGHYLARGALSVVQDDAGNAAFAARKLASARFLARIC